MNVELLEEIYKEYYSFNIFLSLVHRFSSSPLPRNSQGGSLEILKYSMDFPQSNQEEFALYTH
jgi:hypothetical protein